MRFSRYVKELRSRIREDVHATSEVFVSLLEQMKHTEQMLLGEFAVPQQGDEVEDLLERADFAMYQDKSKMKVEVV